VTGAIFGLVGVIVGGLLTGALQAFQEWRSQTTLSRAAARLLSAELSVQQEILEQRAADESAEPVSGEMPAISDWPEHRAVMAKTLDDEAWRAVAAAYARLVMWHWEESRGTETAEDKRPEMVALVDQIKVARLALQRLGFRSNRV
jgi:hypothetical protein